MVPEFRDGLRVTDADSLDVARMVLVGKISRDIVSAVNVHGPLAVGVSGEDAGLILASARNPELGFVGDVAAVNPGIVQRLLAEELIPVVSTIGADLAGQAYNINADTVAGAMAEALGAEKVVYLTDVEGLLSDVDDPVVADQPHRRRAAAEARRHRRTDRRHDPEDRGLRPRRRARRRVGAHPRRPHSPCAPARGLHRLGHRHDDHEGVAVNYAPDADVPAAAGHVRARRGHPPVGRRRATSTSTSCRGSQSRARPRQPGGGRRDQRTSAHAAARVEPLRHAARRRGCGDA